MSCGVVHQIILSKYQLLRRIMWKVPVQTFGFNERLRSKPALFSHPRQAWTAESVSDWMMFAKHLWNSQLPPLNTPQHTPTAINCTRTTGLLRPPWHGLLFMVKSTQNSIGVLRRSQKLSNCPIAHNPIFDRHFPSSISQWKTPKTAKCLFWAPNFEVPNPQKVPPKKNRAFCAPGIHSQDRVLEVVRFKRVLKISWNLIIVPSCSIPFFGGKMLENMFETMLPVVWKTKPTGKIKWLN
jgi:hypothetical protein